MVHAHLAHKIVYLALQLQLAQLAYLVLPFTSVDVYQNAQQQLSTLMVDAFHAQQIAMNATHQLNVLDVHLVI